MQGFIVTSSKKWGLIGAGVGFCLALLIVGFAYYANFHFPGRDLSLPYFILAPTSVLAPPMSYILANATTSIRWKLTLIFALSNAFFYGAVFYFVASLVGRKLLGSKPYRRIKT